MADEKHLTINAEVTAAGSESSLSGAEERAPATIDLEKFGEQEGYVLDEARLREQCGLSADTVLKKDDRGRVLIPQPSDDHEDPLNWSKWKKRAILLVLAVNACTADYSAATGASALIAQAKEWHITPDVVNHATAGNTFMLGVGGIATVWLSAYFGRLPVLFYFQLLSSATAAWAAAAQSFESYMAARILNGMFCVAAAGGGLMWINDTFFFHQRPRMVNIWSTAIILSPFLGPQFMAAILDVASWRVGMWLNFGIITLGLVLIVVFGDETFYPRHLTQDKVPRRQSRLLRLVGVEQVRTKYTGNSLLGAGQRTYLTILKAPVFLTCLFYFFDFPWTIANNTTISVFIIPAYKFSYTNLAAIYTAPVIGAILGLISGHYLFDILARIHTRLSGPSTSSSPSSSTTIQPESRLLALWLILPFKIIGYNLIGLSLQSPQSYSYWTLAVGWAMHNYTTIITTSAVGAYLIDAYPEASGESAAWLNLARTLSGFIVGYIQIHWVEHAGPRTAYGVQSAIMAGAFLVFVVGLSVKGRELRFRCGRLGFKTN